MRVVMVDTDRRKATKTDGSAAIGGGAGGMRTLYPSTWAAIWGNSAVVSSSPSASTTARNIAFSSWRTFPGQSYVVRSASASLSSPRMRLPSSTQNRERKRIARSGTSQIASSAGGSNREHIEAIEEIFPEAPGLDELDQVLVGRRDQAEIDLDRPPRADGIDLPLLERAQELDLSLRRKLADLVEEQRPAIRLGELAGMLVDGPGERSLSCPNRIIRPMSPAARRN